MTRSRQLHLGAFMRPVSIHTGAWRYPGAVPDANFNLPLLKRSIQRLEAAKFDAFFMADHLAVLNMPVAALKRSHTVTSFEPFTLLSALAGATERIGLIATASTTFDEPYHIARRFASLDHISGGRAGWNIVTTANPDAALNFGYDDEIDHDERYRRAREFHDVVTGLWDSFADDAFIRDVEVGIYFDPDKLHVLGHKGQYLSVRGPLNIARPVQGWPVIVQAGASEAGRELAGATAEVIFGAESSIERAQAFHADIRRRMVENGRDPDLLRVLPAAFIVVGNTVEEARAKRAHLDSLVHYDSGIHSLSGMLGHDVSIYDPDGPLPDIPETNASHTARERVLEMARREDLTIRQLAARAGSYSGLAFVGTPATIADEMEQWLETRASDGFNILFSWLPGGLDDFVDRVVPELQRRGLFRREYEGTTLRDHLGLPRPPNRLLLSDQNRRPTTQTKPRKDVMKASSILETIGNTPHIRINRLFGDAEVWVKSERSNPGGSIKDRIALAMIEDAERSGKLQPGGIIIEPTSGNTGIGLALVAAVKGYKLILVMPESMSVERRRLMLSYGATFDLTPREKGMKGAIERANELAAATSGAWIPQQFENPANIEVHARTTAQEILADFADAPIDVLITGVGTGGHITASAEVLKKQWPGLKVFAVEPTLSPVISGGQPGPHPIQGIGAGFIPKNLHTDAIDGVIQIDPNDAKEFARRAAREEGLLVGISSGATLAAIAQKLPELPQGSRVLGFNYDTGERYLSVPDFLPVES